jgi:SOS response regulatory protein OraA/RecX
MNQKEKEKLARKLLIRHQYTPQQIEEIIEAAWKNEPKDKSSRHESGAQETKQT